ncbi:AAEL008066-PA, partial [Aedes aegypti]
SYHPTTNDLHLETRVRGNPVPTLTWSCDGIVIPHSTDKFEIFNQHYYELGTKITNATLIINNPQLKDSGKYTLRAKNEVGKVEVTRQVKIGLRSEHHKKKRMDDIVIQNEAPRVIPKPPTPEPEPEPEPEPVVEEENVQEAEETHEEEEEDEEW